MWLDYSSAILLSTRVPTFLDTLLDLLVHSQPCSGYLMLSTLGFTLMEDHHSGESFLLPLGCPTKRQLQWCAVSTSGCRIARAVHTSENLVVCEAHGRHASTFTAVGRSFSIRLTGRQPGLPDLRPLRYVKIDHRLWESPHLLALRHVQISGTSLPSSLSLWRRAAGYTVSYNTHHQLPIHQGVKFRRSYGGGESFSRLLTRHGLTYNQIALSDGHRAVC